jgi:hypothetical protein
MAAVVTTAVRTSNPTIKEKFIISVPWERECWNTIVMSPL